MGYAYGSLRWWRLVQLGNGCCNGMNANMYLNIYYEVIRDGHYLVITDYLLCD
ncbi:hypothetical protein [Bacillus cereus group sp. BfR-BA-01380]|uniref:hypothetical protein n=1 Tax=Bacillus cereus group sp. BfR-BA-01380 TaxID=2920324 RepID=UPI001F592327|nr:hypothetical protein [Bacillus cereus group sp. BfR-BA-01380]